MEGFSSGWEKEEKYSSEKLEEVRKEVPSPNVLGIVKNVEANSDVHEEFEKVKKEEPSDDLFLMVKKEGCSYVPEKFEVKGKETSDDKFGKVKNEEGHPGLSEAFGVKKETSAAATSGGSVTVKTESSSVNLERQEAVERRGPYNLRPKFRTLLICKTCKNIYESVNELRNHKRTKSCRVDLTTKKDTKTDSFTSTISNHGTTIGKGTSTQVSIVSSSNEDSEANLSKRVKVEEENTASVSDMTVSGQDIAGGSGGPHNSGQSMQLPTSEGGRQDDPSGQPIAGPNEDCHLLCDESELEESD